ncbi:MAG: 2-aminoethylphosphonate--pyruvate transaminase [Planctomycetota bacterium]|nr:MAG: 2-aminoethylphosphonate--pyruvate transaminase [Planctomycetota bacterium]REK37988.1 MAG: 2-aminoethylphosphonate--pyruvate transaminase [Planctomycetota bacterium]
MDDDIPYLLLTPGPLTTTRTVKEVMLRDYCTWDDDYNSIVTRIRGRLVRLALGDSGAAEADYTSVLMQGSGTFSVEATIGSVIPPDGKLLVIDNGAYGNRIALITERLGIPLHTIKQPETEPADFARVEAAFESDPDITHVAMVHCETTTGLLNPAAEMGQLCAKYDKTYILDAMSSFAGVEMTMPEVGCQYLISSANKCIQGVPGFGFVIAHRATFEKTKGWARSLSLDLFDQWHEMETKGGKWRYTSPTHTVRAFDRALDELDEEGGISRRAARYAENNRLLIDGMRQIGFQSLVAAEYQSPIITSFIYPDDPKFDFKQLYDAMKRRRFVIYPGKVTDVDCFRIGNIGHVFPDDIRELLTAIGAAVEELGIDLGAGAQAS